MRRDRLSLAQALQQEHLREDRDSLQENAERPKDLEQSKLVVEQQGQHCAPAQQIFKPDRVNVHFHARAA